MVNPPVLHPSDRPPEVSGTFTVHLNPVSCGTTCIPSQSLPDRFSCRIDTHCQTLPIPLTHHRLWTGRVQQHHGLSRSRRRLPRFERGRPKKCHPQGSRLGRPSETAQNIFGLGFDDTTSSARTLEFGKVHGSSSKASAKPKSPTSGSPLGPITRWSSDQMPPRYCLSDLDRSTRTSLRLIPTAPTHSVHSLLRFQSRSSYRFSRRKSPVCSSSTSSQWSFSV
jgi:hypothetical protein